MTAEIIVQIILLAIALSMDAFAVSITDGLIYKNIDKKKIIFIASTFGLMQAIMPLIGYYVVELVSFIVGENSKQSLNILTIVIVWTAFSLLIFIGTKMIIEGIKNIKSEEENKEKLFNIKEVLIMGVATSIDAFAAGITLHAGLSNNTTVWLHISIILIFTFTLSLIGLILGKQIIKLLKGKQDIAVIIGGAILLLLAVWIVISHYLGI